MDERYPSDGDGSDSNTSCGSGSPGATAFGFRMPDLDKYRHRVRADMAKLYRISPQLSPVESVESVGADMAKHHSMSPANSFNAASTVEVQDCATTSSFPSPPPLLAGSRAGLSVRLHARHRLSTVMERSQEISCSTIYGTVALGHVPEESLLMDARQPTLVDTTFGDWIPSTMTSQLVRREEDLPADRMSDSLVSFIEHERKIMAEVNLNDSA